MRRLSIALVGAALLAVVAAPATAGAQAGTVTSGHLVIVADVALPEGSPEGPFFGDFLATGSAVRRGLVCSAGTLEGARTGDGGMFFDFVVTHEFTCGDGSGSFAIDLWVRLLEPLRTLFVWSIHSGSGDFVDLAGRGAGFGVPSPLGGNVVRDFYFGRAHD